MDHETHVLDPELIGEFQEMLRWWRTRRMEAPHSPPPTLESAPDVYIVRTPAAGIPAKQGDPGSGSPGSGTGTDSAIADVFSANCNCYRIDDSVSSDVDVFKIDRQLPVYNLGTAAIGGKVLLLATKDKTGKWIGTPLNAGTLFVFFSLAAALATTDPSQNLCTVNYYFGGGNPGTMITVWNPAASTNYIFSGAGGKRGIAVYDTGANKFWIIQLEC